MTNKLAQQAINSALSGNWEEAEKINKEILSIQNDDIEALNRLTKVYEETGKPTLTKRYINKALKIDPYNKIALKQLSRQKSKKKTGKKSVKPTVTSAFIEEPGKTKLVTLLRPGSDKIIASLDAGYQVKLNPQGHKISVLSSEGKYIGRLPDDLTARLRGLIKSGNEYEVFVKSISKKNVVVFIRETKRSEKMANVPSFSSEKIEYISFTRPELVYKKANIPKS